MKAIALVDCNSFFCSCERLFRPELKNKPVIVLSNNDGCVISRTPEAKKLGIKMCEPYFKIKKLCEQNRVAVFSSNFSIYTDLSHRVMGTLSKMSSDIEIYSIDEAFLDVTHVQDFKSYGHELKKTILQNVGIPVGVGIAPTKVLAKIANRLAKNSQKAQGVVNLMEKKMQDIALLQTPIEEVWGIGRAMSQKMRSLNIKTAKDLRDYDNELLIQKMFTVVGLKIKKELAGINCFELNEKEEDKKQIMCSRTLSHAVTDKNGLKECVASYTTDVAEKLRAQHSMCRGVTVFARTNHFSDEDQYYIYDSIKIPEPTSDTLKLIQLAFELVDRNFKEGFGYKKVGVILSDFFEKSEYQLSLFEPTPNIQSERLMDVVDSINAKMGENVIQSAACGVEKRAFKMNRNFKSPRYTTSWSELKVFN